MASSDNKTGTRQLWAAAWFAVDTVLRLKPKLFISGFGHEAFSRTVPFVEAFLAARIISLLPGLADTAQREASFRSIILTLLSLGLLKVVQQFEASIYELYERRHMVDLDALIGHGHTQKFASLPYARYEEKTTIDLYERSADYINSLGGFVMFRLRSMAGAVYTVLLTAVALTHFSILLTIVVAIIAVPQLMLELRVNREQQRKWRDNTVSRRQAYSYEDLLRPQYIKDTRLFGLVNYVLDKTYHLKRKTSDDQLLVDQSVEKYRFLTRLLDAAVEVSALAYVVRLIYTGTQPIGQFVFAQQILQQYSGALSDIMAQIQDLDEVLAGAIEYRAFMKLADRQGGNTQIDPRQVISLNDVSFTYPGATTPALSNVTLSIEAGQTVAFVGENGAGKTTLVKLLMKLYEPSQGHIAVGEQRLELFDEDAWHQHLGVLFQDFVSFRDFTIRENIFFGRLSRRKEDKDIRHAASQAGAAEFIEALPKGIDTYLGKFVDEENGTELSGGQLQRVAIARVLFRDPAILIMDEPTSAVDAKAEYEIFRELDKFRQAKTTILISHRFSTVRKANYIFVLHKGRLVEQGSHEELMTLNKRYAGLFNAQAEGYR